jgi:Predicted integral membrane protein
MIREKLIEKGVGQDRKFRWRSHEASRIEGLSDAVFGFAVTLLVVSLEVPKTFGELMATMRGFGAFAISFALLIVVWYTQYKFFRRYALQDNFTVVINAALLFVVLFYVYPLKFVFTFLVSLFTGHKGEVHLANGSTIFMVETADQVAKLMVIFSVGYMAVFGIFVLLYWHAYRKRDQLELNELEVFDTRTDIREGALNVAIAAVSVLFGLSGYGSLAGMTYMVIPAVMMAHGMMSGRKRRRMEKRLGFHENTMFEPS